MNQSVDQYFALIVPFCAILQGLALVGCWSAMRQQRHLLWIAASYILPAFPLAAHSLMDTSELAAWAIPAGLFYLFGIWAAARGMADKYGGTAHPNIAAGIIAVSLAVLFYFSYFDDQLWVRVLCLNVAIFLLLVLPVKSIFPDERSPIFIERVLRLSFVLLVVYAFLRVIVVYVFVPQASDIELTRSGYWLFMLATNLVITLWFTFVLLACVMREMFQTLKTERNQDSLTRLLNRRAFFEQADRQLQLITGYEWALIACDVDHFKHVNDTWGHGAGDQVLTVVGQTLSQQVRQDDLVARFGGEEFIILLKCKDILSANMIAERMRVQIEQTYFPVISGSVTASFGVTLIGPKQTLTQAIEQADAMLYQAKRSGRNKVVHVLQH